MPPRASTGRYGIGTIPMNAIPRRKAYRDAGVDVAAGDALVEAIRPLAETTRRSGCVGSIGGFGAVFDLSAAGYRDPLLISATDGVGTKLRVAIESGHVETIGVDLVAMCVNDLLCHGAEPLFFLDYYATGRLTSELAERVIAGIASGCRNGGLALIGGETAELPGMYAPGDFDLAGFAVGAVERDGLLPLPLSPGDAVIAILAEGPHANGYSLIRKLVREAGLAWEDPAPFQPEVKLGHALLAPTAIYAGPCLELLRAGQVRALAHVTGGGLAGNLPRILGPGQAIRVDADGWALPPVFQWIMKTGDITWEEMLAVFHCGVGMVAVCSTEDTDRAIRIIRSAGFRACRFGEIVARKEAAVEFPVLPPGTDS